MSGPNEDDGKHVAQLARREPGVDQMLRQFLNHDGPAGTSKAFRENYDRSFEKGIEKPFKCDECGECYVTEEDLFSHERADHTHCRKCGNAFTLDNKRATSGLPEDESGLWAAQICERCAP